MTTTIPTRTASAAPVRPVVPRPLWERHDLFQEPAYPAGLKLIEDDEEDELNGGPSFTAVKLGPPFN